MIFLAAVFVPTGDFSLFGFLLREIGVGPWRMQDYGLAALDVVGLGGDFVGVLHKTPFKECGQCTIHPPAFASCSESHTALRAAGCVTSTAYVANVAHIRIAQAVMTIADTPLKHLQIVAGQYERHKDFCFKVSIIDSYWSQLRRTGKTRKSLGNRLARDPELALGSLSDFWMRTTLTQRGISRYFCGSDVIGFRDSNTTTGDTQSLLPAGVDGRVRPATSARGELSSRS